MVKGSDTKPKASESHESGRKGEPVRNDERPNDKSFRNVGEKTKKKLPIQAASKVLKGNDQAR